MAAEISKRGGSEVVYRGLPLDACVEQPVGPWLPGPSARVLADCDFGVERGDMFTDRGDLSRLVGRPTTPKK